MGFGEGGGGGLLLLIWTLVISRGSITTKDLLGVSSLKSLWAVLVEGGGGGGAGGGGGYLL